MDAAALFRVIALIPDRMPRSQSGTVFDGAASERVGLLCRFLGWLGPLNPISKEEQQLLGVRAPVVKPLAEAEGEAAEDAEPELREDSLEEQPVNNLPGAGTRLAA